MTAVEVSRVALQRAQSHAAAAGLAVTWVHTGLLDAGLPDAFFDLVSAQYPALRRTPGDDAERALLGAVAPGGTRLVVHHDVSDPTVSLENGFDPNDWVGPRDVAELLGDDWHIDVERAPTADGQRRRRCAPHPRHRAEGHPNSGVLSPYSPGARGESRGSRRGPRHRQRPRATACAGRVEGDLEAVDVVPDVVRLVRVRCTGRCCPPDRTPGSPDSGSWDPSSSPPGQDGRLRHLRRGAGEAGPPQPTAGPWRPQGGE